jgi:hypothetical protein
MTKLLKEDAMGMVWLDEVVSICRVCFGVFVKTENITGINSRFMEVI